MTELEISTYVIRGFITILLGVICYFVRVVKNQFVSVKESLAEQSKQIARIQKIESKVEDINKFTLGVDGKITSLKKEINDQISSLKKGLKDNSISLDSASNFIVHFDKEIKSINENLSVLQGLVISERVMQNFKDNGIDLKDLKNNGKTVESVIHSVITASLKGKK